MLGLHAHVLVSRLTVIRPPGLLALTALALSAGLLAAPAARADVVHLKDGRRLEGSITREGDLLIVRHRFGEARVPAADVQRIEDTPDAWDEVERMRRDLAQGTAEERYRFASACRQHGFEEEARRAYLSVLRVDLDHPGARAALGYVRHEGRWITQDDLHRLRGLVEHEGVWVTPEETAAREAAAAEEARARREAAAEERRVAREERLARREAEREERRARREAYEAALARARVEARVEQELERNRRGASSTSVMDAYGAVLLGGRRVIVSPYTTYGRGALWGCSGRRTVTYGRSSGLRLSGSYSGGDWQLRWRLGY